MAMAANLHMSLVMFAKISKYMDIADCRRRRRRR